MTVPKWLKELFKKKEPLLLAIQAEHEPLTTEQRKVRKTKRVAQRAARKRNRR